MIDGLMQAGVDCWVPVVHPFPRMDDFLEALPGLFPADTTLRLLAHPLKVPSSDASLAQGETPPRSLSLSEVSPPSWWKQRGPLSDASSSPPSVVVAVGPEGGWTDEELAAFTSHEHLFTEVNLGSRILRTEVAVSVCGCWRCAFGNLCTHPTSGICSAVQSSRMDSASHR